MNIPGVVVHTANPNAEKVETGESLNPLARQPILLTEFQNSERPWRKPVSKQAMIFLRMTPEIYVL